MNARRIVPNIPESSGGRSSLRRWLNAFRHRLSKRGRSKPPDQFLDKFSSTTASETRLHQTAVAQALPSDGTCSRLSVDPSLPSHYRWLSVVSLAVLYNIVFVIGRAVFWEINRQAPALWWTLDYLCDFIYLADTLVHCHEGYLEQGLLVRDASKLRRHYFSKQRWWLDVVSMLPTDLAYIWWAPSSCAATRLPCPIIVRINRLLRLPRMWEWFDRTETATGYPNAFRICKVVLAILVLIHWNACLYFAISYALGFSTDNWVYNINGAKNLTLSRQYIYSFYWSTLTLTTIGETPTPENDAEYLFVVADFLAGVLIFATIVGYSDLFCLAKRDLWETLADYPEARASLTERGCQLLRKDGLLDEAVFASAQHQQDTLESGVAKLEQTVENLNLRLARLLAEYSASQAKLKQRISKLEER
ncbi:AAEL014581-PA [Aedes aegypti]|uniref:AAEL014581-PA n=1 Tax=Aedes aegypti TaxID=7159 RepID=Q16FZ6_AEDAE|nr:AAEL014581-PA [Aedes aegypti]